MSAFANPFVINADGQVVGLERIPLSSGSEGIFTEKHLQSALFQNPQSLPVREIDPHIGTLVPICMEVETGSGPADILYVTLTGQIVLVETKLWRNPESRREVVAQILDYAKELTKWTYDDLDRAAAIASKSGPGYLLNCLKPYGVDEANFVDGINRSLSIGDFLLLIVGDGIQSRAASLVGFIEQYGNLRFGLGLIEVAAYKLPNNALLLQPRILAKTEILQRTVFVGESGAIELEQMAAKDDAETPQNTDSTWFQEFWADYLKVLRLDDPLQPPIKRARSTNIFLPMPPSGSISWISAYIAQSTGVGGVYLTFLKSYEKINEVYEQLLSERENIEREVAASLNWERIGNKIYIAVPNISTGNLDSLPDRQRVIQYLAEMTNKMVNAFRHRLDAMTRK